MRKTVLPNEIINTFDYLIVSNAYLKKIRPQQGFVGGFSMMMIAGPTKPAPPEKSEEDYLKDSFASLMEETSHKLETKLQADITKFFSTELNNIEMNYRVVPMINGDRAELGRPTPVDRYPSLIFTDEVLGQIIELIGRMDYQNVVLTKLGNEINIVFDNRKDLIRYVKDRDITISAFGKKWKP